MKLELELGTEIVWEKTMHYASFMLFTIYMAAMCDMCESAQHHTK